MSEPVIELRGVGKRYGDTMALDGVELVVERGECFALLGPNGAGKTTTVEICEGYRSASSGSARVLGEDPAHGDRTWRERLGIVLQTTTAFEDITVSELVAEFAAYYPNRRDVSEVIGLVGLAEKARARAGTLSGGQRRRLDVAIGIVGRPELLFLDEPTTGFDPEARREFWDVVTGLRGDGTTIVLTTHYLDEAEHLADRVGVIVGGRITEVATPATLGGRDRAPARVTYVDDDGLHVLDTHTPARTVGELSERFGGEVPGLTVTRPSLEDVYLSMIGAS